jgi:Tricorn protease C1 domain
MRAVFQAVLLSFCLIGFKAAAQDTAKPLQNINPLNGRWNIAFDIPQQQYRTVVEFLVSDDEKVGAVNLGYPLIKFTEGHFAENKLLLKGVSPYGAVEVNATIEGDKFNGKWRVVLLGGDVRGTRDGGATCPKCPQVSRLAVFDAVWETLDKQFYDPLFNGVDWRNTRARFRLQAEATRTDGELVTVIRNMLGELRSSHLNFSALTLEQSFTATKTNATDAIEKPIVWRKLSPTIGYIQIKQFDESCPLKIFQG